MIFLSLCYLMVSQNLDCNTQQILIYHSSKNNGAQHLVLLDSTVNMLESGFVQFFAHFTIFTNGTLILKYVTIFNSISICLIHLSLHVGLDKHLISSHICMEYCMINMLTFLQSYCFGRIDASNSMLYQFGRYLLQKIL